MEGLELITETVEGYPVKGLRLKPMDNIIVGQIKDPIWGNPNLYDGWITGMWRKNGTPIKKIEGREDLKIEIP